jgi:hypothetical protein
MFLEITVVEGNEYLLVYVFWIVSYFFGNLNDGYWGKYFKKIGE